MHLFMHLRKKSMHFVMRLGKKSCTYSCTSSRTFSYTFLRTFSIEKSFFYSYIGSAELARLTELRGRSGEAPHQVRGRWED